MNEIVLLIPHFNNPLGLIASLMSIGSTEKIDVIIVDDGSTKHGIDEIATRNAFTANGKLVFIYLDINKGIEHALNKGLEYISKNIEYKFVARLDCGDLCTGKRFEIQEIFLKENPEIKLVGSNVVAVNTKGVFLYNINMPINDKEIKNKMYFNSMLIHPTIMFSSEILATIGHYPINHKYAEDYAFFFAIIKKYKVANINQYLLQIEINENGISLSGRRQQVKSRINIIKGNFYFGYYPIYGLLRNYILLYTPYKLILFLKKKLNNEISN
ncbi:glycosyltransferase [Flavobacterium psychrotolerans]|uniref:Glycosyl transferase family 2 n=1 Tax=Flavobacterium psychrotolerans TaxID=2169410 RepID=A0A2U1JNX3_9FLAO|nr:glycosyltransferase [Flavobacterium psychrotolerans]PWA06871.1 glycosyl transferase family 2 [Flavobacterium psychrotolerans]